MLIQQSFIKAQNERRAKVIDNVIGNELPNSSEPQKFDEHPFVSLKRVFGDKFYDLSDTNIDVMEILCQDEGSFDKKFFEQDMKIGGDAAQFVSFLFQGFYEMNGGQVALSLDQVRASKAKIAVLSTKDGVVKNTFTLEDMKSLVRTDDQGNFVDYKYFKPITDINLKIQQNDAATKNANGNNDIISKLDAEYEGLIKNLSAIYVESANEFMKFIVEKSGCDLKDVYSVVMSWEIKNVDPQTNKEWTKMNIAQWHDIGYYSAANLRQTLCM